MNNLKSKKNIVILQFVLILIAFLLIRGIFHGSTKSEKNALNLEKVEFGMSEFEVNKIMGEPYTKMINSWEHKYVYEAPVGYSGDFEIGISPNTQTVSSIYRGQ